jgi:tetratricopeptide (TPR) repeat protein
VLDFGLAAPVPEALATGRYATLGAYDQTTSDVPTMRAHRGSPPRPITQSVSSLITAHGKVMGTPAYMAPEQSRAEATDARADQYSFCVALWEALFGERPGGPATVTARIRLQRRLTERGAHGADVPASIQQALERGLSADPADRFPNMDALLAVLSMKTTSRRRRALAVGLCTVGAGAVGVLLATLTPSNAELCPREQQALAGTWDPSVREQIHAQLGATDRPYATATSNTIERELERWSSRWLDARVDACEDTKVRHTQSLALLDVRMACLDRQRNALAAVTASLAGGWRGAATGDQSVDTQLEAALASVLQLPDPQRCARSALIGGGALMHEDPQQDELLEHKRQQLQRARALLSMGKHDEALALVETTSGTESSQPLLAEAGLLRGQILAGSGRFEDAEHDLRHAVFLAQTNGYDTVSVEACAALTDLLVHQDQLDSAADWHELGRATLARIGGDPHLEASLRFAGARLAVARGEFGVALADQRRVLEIREQLYGPDHIEVAEVLVDLVGTQTQLELYPEAQADIERALKILTTEFGITHPEVGRIYARYAALEHARGADLDALSKQLDALAIFELAYGESHERVAEAYAALAAIQLALGQRSQALAELDHARSIRVELYGPTDPTLAPMMIDIGRLLHALGRDEEALAELDNAEQLVATAAPPSGSRLHGEISMARGDLHFDAGRYADALTDFRLALTLSPSPLTLGAIASAELQLARRGSSRTELELALTHQHEALALRQAALGEDAPELAVNLIWIGVGLIELERFTQAEQPLTHALELLDGSATARPLAERELAARLKGRAHMALARLAWPKPGQQPRARELARAAHDELELAGAPAARELDVCKTWLRLHGA